MTKKITGNKNGNQLEDFVENILIDAGYQFIDKKKILTARVLQQKLYTKQKKICETIYHTAECPHYLNADFLIYNPSDKKEYFVIECKSQTSGGSVDEKYPYFYQNIIEKSPYNTIVVLDGTGAKKGAKQWLKSKEGTGNLYKVFLSFSEFREWAIKNGL